MPPPERAKPAAPPLLTRIPRWRPGVWVRLYAADRAEGVPADLAGKLRRVKSLTCAITAQDLRPVWRVHFHDGRCVEVRLVEREATAEEIRDAERRPN